MYPGLQAKIQPRHPAFIMAASGERMTYAELEASSNRLAHFLRACSLRRLDHYSIFMENNARYVECCSAGERAGLYYTCINSYLTPDEVAYILDNSESKILITSMTKLEVALAAIAQCPRIECCLLADGPGDLVPEQFAKLLAQARGRGAGRALIDSQLRGRFRITTMNGFAGEKRTERGEQLGPPGDGTTFTQLPQHLG